MFDWIKEKYTKIEKESEQFRSKTPYPIISLENFLPEDVALDLYRESCNIPIEHWKRFTRNGSHMVELNKVELMPTALNLLKFLNGSHFLKYLEKLTGLESLIPDPHLIGAGYSKSFTGDTLQVHTDFNWNEELKVHRALSLIIYITPGWEEKFGGGLSFYDKDRSNIVYQANCLFNSAVLWEYNKYAFHGYETPINCPDELTRSTFRLFYYQSYSTHNPNDPPHRSLYWVDPNTNEPIDKVSEV